MASMQENVTQIKGNEEDDAMGRTLADEQEQEQDQDKGRGTHFTHVQMQIRPEHVKEIVTSGNVSRAAPDVGQAFWVGGGEGCG